MTRNGNPLRRKDLPEGRIAPEEPLPQGVAQDRDAVGGPNLVRVEEAPLGERPGPDRGVVRAHATVPRRPVPVACDDLDGSVEVLGNEPDQGVSRRMASASSGVRVMATWEPARTPLTFREPASTQTKA